MLERERFFTFCQMSKSDSPNTLVISSSAVTVLIDLMMVVKDTIALMTMMLMMMMMKMLVKMVLDLTYVSIWVSPMLALNRLSWSFACKCHRQYIQYINISQENTVKEITCMTGNSSVDSIIRMYRSFNCLKVITM